MNEGLLFYFGVENGFFVILLLSDNEFFGFVVGDVVFSVGDCEFCNVLYLLCILCSYEVGEMVIVNIMC